MIIDSATLEALEIFASPMSGKAVAWDRDSFSVASILDRTSSITGSRVLRNWLRRPLVDIELIRERHDAIDFLLIARTAAPEVWVDLKRVLRRARDLPRLVLRMKAFRADVKDWCGLEASLLACNEARAVVIRLIDAAKVSAPPLVVATIADFDAGLGVAQITLDSVIDWGASRAAGKVVVRGGIDDSLDEYRRLEAELPGRLCALAAQEARAVPLPFAYRYEAMHMIGVVAVIDKRAHTANAQQPMARLGTASSSTGQTPRPMIFAPESVPQTPPDWALHYESAHEYYFKNATCAQLDAYFGDPTSVIADLQRGIVQQLEDQVLGKHEGSLLKAGSRLGEIDALLALTDAAADYTLRRPTMTTDAVLFVRGARHALAEIAVSSFVPNDLALAAGRSGAGPVVLLTGPNASGKSVFLKSLGIIVVLAQAGAFVPADAAVVGIVDRLFSRLASVETANGGATGGAAASSAFGIDAAQVGVALAHATSHSLVLIDEWGKGTHALDGASLLAATVRNLAAREPPPRTVITTHFREIFEAGLLGFKDGHSPTADAAADSDASPLPSVAFYQMKCLLRDCGAAEATADIDGDGAGDDRDAEIVPLFKVVHGVALASYGLECARKAGMPKAILDRAHDVTLALSSKTHLAPHPDAPPARADAEPGGRGATAGAVARLLMTRTQWGEGSPAADLDLQRLLELVLETSGFDAEAAARE